jgi:CDP-glycerol glycerophosphotransferase
MKKLPIKRASLKKVLWHLCHEMLYILLLPLDILIPKRKNYWIFTVRATYPWGDSMRQLFEAAIADPKIIPILLVSGLKRRDDIIALYPDAIIVKRFSLKGIGYFLRSTACFISYGNRELYTMLFPQFRHFITYVPHGISLKSTGFAEVSKRDKGRKFLNPYYLRSNISIANSKIDKLAISACKGANPHDVTVTGLPRNDLMHQAKLQADLQTQEDQLKKAKNDRKLVLYAFTWRDWEDDFNPLAEKNDLQALAEVVYKNGGILGVTHHTLTKPLPIEGIPNVIDCRQIIYPNPQILLRNTDILISDYSSIWIDYLIMDRPVIGFCYDYERYMRDRSLLFDFDRVFPGKITYEVPQLLAALDDSLQGKESVVDANKREYSRKFFYSYFDNNSTKRVIDTVKEKIFSA